MVNKKDEGHIEALRDALDEAGSMNKLAAACNCTHAAFSLALKRGTKLSAELALAVSKATSVERERLRPDLWGPESE